MERKKLTIGHLFPDMLTIYGDKGNILTLTSRLAWRDMDAEVISFTKEDSLCFDNLDILYLGGGDHNAQKQVYERLLPHKDELSAYVEAGGVLLATCGGFEMLGICYEAQGEKMPGLGILNINTQPGKGRLIGNVVIESDLTGKTEQFVGFENHAGRTHIGDYTPFGRVISGHGNNGEDGTCGVSYKNVIGTHLHGPLLPKNPILADWILSKALEKKYGEKTELSPLHDGAEQAAHDYAVKRFTQK